MLAFPSISAANQRQLALAALKVLWREMPDAISLNGRYRTISALELVQIVSSSAFHAAVADARIEEATAMASWQLVARDRWDVPLLCPDGSVFGGKPCGGLIVPIGLLDPANFDRALWTDFRLSFSFNVPNIQQWLGGAVAFGYTHDNESYRVGVVSVRLVLFAIALLAICIYVGLLLRRLGGPHTWYRPQSIGMLVFVASCVATLPLRAISSWYPEFQGLDYAGVMLELFGIRLYLLYVLLSFDGLHRSEGAAQDWRLVCLAVLLVFVPMALSAVLSYQAIYEGFSAVRHCVALSPLSCLK